MYDNQVFVSGVYGVFVAEWRLVCETPMAVRNGVKTAFRTRDRQKSRGQSTQFYWRKKNSQEKQDIEVVNLCFGYKVTGNQVSMIHFIPSSSIRGSLRSWTINNLISKEYRSSAAPPSKSNPEDLEKYLVTVQDALDNPTSGYHWVASIFGLAFDSRISGGTLSNAGRLRIETHPFENSQPQPIVVNGEPDQINARPDNVRRQMVVRNPLDRVTHASREGGLHHFLEFCKGEQFQVRLTILNPRGSDLGLIGLWRRELNSGMLRVGALSSIGRGRVSIKPDSEVYQVWVGPGAPSFPFTAGKNPDTDQGLDNDPLAGLWDKFSITPDDLEACITDLGKT